MSSNKLVAMPRGKVEAKVILNRIELKLNDEKKKTVTKHLL